MSTLTGKQKAFVNFYLGDCNFNATLATKMAGYRANSKHSFEAIGSENLTRPGIKSAIDEHFKLAHVSAEEVLIELGTLARGNSKDKIKALALLSQHHGLLDHGKWQARNETPLEIQVRYVEPELAKREQEVDEWKDGIERDINELNEKGMKIYNAARAKFADSQDVQSFCELYEKMLGGKAWADSESTQTDPDIMLPTEKPLEVEIIPPSRRLQASPAERLTATVVAQPVIEPEIPEPERCRHGHVEGQCHVMDVGKDQCPHWYRKTPSSRYFAA